MTTIASQITSLTVVYSTVYSDADQRKHQSSTSLAFVWGIHRDRWIPAQRASYAGNVSIWWRHHAPNGKKVLHYWPFVRGIHRSPVDSPHEGRPVTRCLMFLWCVPDQTVEQIVEMPMIWDTMALWWGVQSGAVITQWMLSKFPTKVTCWFILWFTPCLSQWYICNIMSYWTSLWRHLTVYHTVKAERNLTRRGLTNMTKIVQVPLSNACFLYSNLGLSSIINTLRTIYNCRRLADDTFNLIFVNEIVIFWYMQHSAFMS